MRSRQRTDSNCHDIRRQWLAEHAAPGLVAETVAFILYSKKWWLAPIIIALLLLSLIAGLSGTGAAPLIYTLF